MRKDKKRYYLFDFCNGELMKQEDFESSTELNIYLKRHYIESPIIIYGFDLTDYFVKGEKNEY